MDKKYVELLKELAKSSAESAEVVMDYNRQKNDETGLKTATIMRDDFQNLSDLIIAAGDNYAPNKDEARKLLVCALIMANQLQSRLENMKRALNGYQTDLIPKLQDIVDNAKDDEAAKQMANEKFIIEKTE